jgi:hypothetical protein
MPSEAQGGTMKHLGLTAALEAELNRKISELDAENSYFELFLNDVAPTAKSSSVSDFEDKAQHGVTIPRYMGAANSFVTNPSNVGIGIIARMIETDATVLSAVQFKSLMVQAKIGEYHHEDDGIQEFVRDFIGKMYGPTFREACEAMLSKFGYGFSISEIIWGINKNSLKVPIKVKTYHPSTICFEVDPYGDVTDQGVVQFVIQNTQSSNPNFYVPAYQYGFQVKNPFTTPNDYLLPYRMPFLNNYGLTRIPRNKCVHHINGVGQAFGSPYGKTSVRTAHLAWQLKVYFMKQMGIAGKRQAAPFIHGTAPHGQNKVAITRPDGVTVQMNPVEALSAMLAARQDDDSIVTGPEKDGYTLQAIAATIDLNQYLAVLNWLDVQIFRAFLLPSLVMTDGSAGSRSLGDKHFQVVDRIAEEDSQLFTQTLIDQLIRPAIAMNFGEQDNYGHFAQRPQNIEERERLANMFGNLANAGFMKAYDPKDGDYVRSTLHLPEQDESFYAQPMPNYDPLNPEGDEPSDEPGAEPKPHEEDPTLSGAELMGVRRTVNYKGFAIVVTEFNNSYGWQVERGGSVKDESSKDYKSVDQATADAKNSIDRMSEKHVSHDSLSAQVNWTVKARLHFEDGINDGQITVKAESESDARDVATARLKDTWDRGGLKRIEIISVRKG